MHIPSSTEKSDSDYYATTPSRPLCDDDDGSMSLVNLMAHAVCPVLSPIQTQRVGCTPLSRQRLMEILEEVLAIDDDDDDEDVTLGIRARSPNGATRLEQ
jgi:hypothetical protein